MMHLQEFSQGYFSFSEVERNISCKVSSLTQFEMSETTVAKMWVLSQYNVENEK